ncbi:hypothetical protein T265_07734 [Opisthorchis viverrini]|uniref:Uncharacterized protein n=1 Tax=Opisthorchis viverrini TaxID=6198 RepID=A0A074ZBG9_OPIVI|nr:hypothetical protein T265_07734 [Opisthorchis viverrini]KER24636.1 hypothetical protein T265_07734 [Opisthorchis viverrini]
MSTETAAVVTLHVPCESTRAPKLIHADQQRKLDNTLSPPDEESSIVITTRIKLLETIRNPFHRFHVRRLS